MRLTGLFEKVLFQLAIEDSRIVPAARLILEMLTPHLERRLSMLDPVGWVVERAKGDKQPLRFGLDSNEVVKDRRELHAEKWLLRTEWLRLGGKLAPEDKLLRKLFVDKFDDFRDNFILPVEESLSELRRSKIRLRRDGADSEARLIGQFVGHVRLVLDQVLEVSKVVAYQELITARRRGLTKKQRKRLKAAIKGVGASYSRLVTQKSSDSAVDGTLARLAKGAKRCVVLIEPSDAKGVLRKFVQRSPDDVGLIVLGVGKPSP